MDPAVLLAAAPGEGCSPLDVSCQVGEVAGLMLRDQLTKAIRPVFTLLGETLLSTPLPDERVRQLWTGSLVVANTAYVLLIVAGGIMVMSHQNLPGTVAIKDVAPRLVLGFVASNTSLLLATQAITFANGLSAALLGRGVKPAGVAAEMMAALLQGARGQSLIFLLMVAVAVLLALVLVLIFVIRVMLTILLIAAAPLALACHALPGTEGVARLWWRAFTGVLMIQIAQALVLIAALQVFFTPDVRTIFGVRNARGIVDVLITLCLLYVLVRIPSWVARSIFNLGSSPLMRAGGIAASLLIWRRLRRRGGGKPGKGWKPTQPPKTPPPAPPPPSPPAPTAPEAYQPTLPLDFPSPPSQQLRLPFLVDPATASAPKRQWTQLRLPEHPAPPRQLELFDRPEQRAEQLELPMRIPEGPPPTQMLLPLEVPPAPPRQPRQPAGGTPGPAGTPSRPGQQPPPPQRGGSESDPKQRGAWSWRWKR